MESANSCRSVEQRRRLLQPRPRGTLLILQSNVGQNVHAQQGRNIALPANQSQPPKRGPNENRSPDCSGEQNSKQASPRPRATPSKEQPGQKQVRAESDAGHGCR